MEKVNISVVIPTCDRPQILHDTLNSVFNQSNVPCEIIIVDNGITAVTINPYKYGVSVKYIRALPRFGVSQARNVGAIIAKGDYIAFLDDDDLWEDDYLEEIHRAINESGAEIILACRKDLITREINYHKSIEIIRRESFINELFKRNPGVTGSSTVVKRELFFTGKGYDPYLTTGQDKAMILELLLNNKDIKVIRAKSAYMLHRQDYNIERQVEIHKRIQGKRRFLYKYWRYMNVRTRARVTLQLGRLYVNRALGKKH